LQPASEEGKREKDREKIEFEERKGVRLSFIDKAFRLMKVKEKSFK